MPQIKRILIAPSIKKKKSNNLCKLIWRWQTNLDMESDDFFIINAEYHTQHML